MRASAVHAQSHSALTKVTGEALITTDSFSLLIDWITSLTTLPKPAQHGGCMDGCFQDASTLDIDNARSALAKVTR